MILDLGPKIFEIKLNSYQLVGGVREDGGSNLKTVKLHKRKYNLNGDRILMGRINKLSRKGNKEKKETCEWICKIYKL